MAFSGIMCTEAEIDAKTGSGVSASYTDDMKTQALLAAESTVNIVAGFNFSDVWAATLNVDKKYLITDICASLVAIDAIAYDTTGYADLIEAEDKITVCRDAALRGLSILREQSNVDFINKS